MIAYNRLRLEDAIADNNDQKHLTQPQ